MDGRSEISRQIIYALSSRHDSIRYIPFGLPGHSLLLKPEVIPLYGKGPAKATRTRLFVCPSRAVSLSLPLSRIFTVCFRFLRNRGSIAMDGNSTAPNRLKDPRTIARKYQLDLCKRAVEENIIVYLGTGCGKTHIAVLLMYELGHLIRKPSKSICIFLAPTVPLVRQQAMVIESSTDFKVRCHYGSQKNLKDHDDWNKEMDQSEEFYKTKGGTDLSNYTKCINSLENLLDAKVCSVDDELELEGFVASPDIKVYFYGPLFCTASSLTFAYSKKLEDIKVQAARKADMPETEIASINNDNFLIDQYLTKALSILIGDLFDGNNDVDSLTIGALEEPFFSNKLAVLVGILASYRLQATAKCIIFVKRIIVAKSLAYILGSLESLTFWKCEFLVGCHGGKESMSRGKMNTVVERFSSGEVNLLVATNVAEEGLDIQTCCLVVRFDLPETVASFIQSRGRARMTISKYVFLVERGNEHEGKLLNDFMASEDIMNKEITSRTSNETFDDLEEVNYKVNSTGASINTGCSVSLLHRYCDKLPRDKYFTPSPKFYYIDDLNGTICRIILPPNAPLRQVDGLPCSSKDEAKRNACLKACKELHERGALTDYLLPDINSQRKIGPATHHSEYNSNSIEDESSREELYEMLVPAALRRSWSNDDTNINLHFYYIRFVPKPKDRQYRMFGLFIKNPLPQEAESLKVDLHLTHGRIVETTLTPQGMTTFDKEEIMLAQNFQEMFLKIILDRSEFYSDLVPLGKCNASQDCSSKSYLLLPVIEQLYEGQKMIDWTTVRHCLTSPAFIDVSATFENAPCCTSDKLQLLNGSVNKADVVNSLVFTPHNNLFFFVDGILYETNANSCYKGTECESYAEYYRDRFHVKLSYPEQPFLKAKRLFVCRNLLHNRVQANTEARELVEHFVELPPELCSLKIVGFSKDIGSTLSLLPSLMHRMENLLVAIELKEVLSSSFPEASEIRADRILEALTTEKCLERLSLERFEVLGDSFLKYAVARHSFLTYEAYDEGQLTRRRSSIVNNSNLYELAIAKKLQVYIRDELFDPTQFYALGRPCKMVCNIDTESVIHQRENENLNIAAEGHNFRCTKSHHWLHRKTIADVVEALVGAFLVESGFKAAIAFLRWIGISADFDVSNIYRVWESSNSNLSLISNINVNELEEILGYTFRCKGLLLQAFVHASYNKHSGGCYQKLEFLGDAVLEYLITSYLYSVFPELKPGQITDLRSITVNNNSFANVAVWLSLHKYLMKDARSLDEAINKFESFVPLPDLEKDLIEEPACPKINPLRELRELCQYFNFAMRLPDPVKVGGDYCVKVETDVKDEHLMFTSTNKSSKTARRMAAQEALSMLKARGYKLKSKPLEDIVQSAKKERPKLIGYDEEPIVIDNLDSIPLEKLQIQITEETPHSLGLEKANDASTLNCSGNPCSSRMELTRADTSESCNGNNGQIQQTMSDYVEISGTSPGTLAHKTAKSRLMEICATNHWGDPLFECCKEEGPSHLKMFTYKVAVEVQHESSVCLECFSEPKPQKKAAQDHAAEGALWYLKHIGYIL
ncbi:hypothetical protein MUK42_13295 [Musa troglodytarum]|uniref:Dicer-like protein 4 n=1 Tax=Musa troglodytarum TaxID=320322 RepID=A0A9E7HK96_9LILI|nr:hypothetical protein MUK42_13295 [Musa troglodytarum]